MNHYTLFPLHPPLRNVETSWWPWEAARVSAVSPCASFGWHYLSDDTCLMRTHLFSAA